MGKFRALSTILAIAGFYSLLSGTLLRAETDEDVTTIVLFGDSIAAGYGLPPEEGLAHKLEVRLNESSQSVVIQPAGVSGDTTAGGLSRLDWSIGPEADIIILVLGGNDALRAIPPEQTAANIDALVGGLAEKGIQVLLTGMRAPPNLGPEYAAEFEPIFARVAEKYETSFYPFILEGVAANPKLNQPDGIHPNADGVDIIVEGLTPLLIEMIGLPNTAGPT